MTLLSTISNLITCFFYFNFSLSAFIRPFFIVAITRQIYNAIKLYIDIVWVSKNILLFLISFWIYYACLARVIFKCTYSLIFFLIFRFQLLKIIIW